MENPTVKFHPVIFYKTGISIHQKLIHLSLFLIFFISSLYSVQAQNYGTIKGSVISDSGETLPGVNVILKNTHEGVVTNNQGEFEIHNLIPGRYVLQASFVGYKTQQKNIELKASQTLEITIRLDEEVIETETINIQGKSVARQINDQSYEVQAITTKGLENLATDAKSILNGVSGVRIAEDGGVGSNSTFSLNGFSGSQVKFFLDGIPMDNFGSSMSLGDLPVNMIKRIEVYKGVVPVWLGNDALGGAVNIITHNTAKYLDVSYAYGSFNTHRASINSAYSWENGFTIRENFFYNYSDNDYNVYVAKGNGDNEEKWYRRFHDQYKSGTAKIELGVVGKSYADNLLLGLIATGNTKQEQTGATMAKVYGGVLHESQSLIGTLKYNKQNLLVSGLDMSFYGAYTNNESHAIDTLRGVSYDWSGIATVTPGSNDGEIGDRTFTIFNIDEITNQLNASYAMGTNSTLSLNYALSYYHRTVKDSLNPDEENNFFPKVMTKHVFGLAYKYDWAKRWSTTLFTKYYDLNAKTSKRYDQLLTTERVEELTSRQKSAGYGLASSYFITHQSQLKLSYEHAFRMPTPLEMFGDGLFVNPNSDLRPESSDNINLSIDYHNAFDNHHHFSVGASFLYRNAKDLIYVKVSPGSPESSYANSLKIRFLGTEGNVRYQYNEWFHLSANVTYQNITDRAKEILIQQASGDYWQTNYSYGFRLPNRPYLFGNLNTGVNFQNILQDNSNLRFDYFLNFTEKYFLTWVEMGTNNDKYIIPPQWSHDIQLSYSFKGGKYNISAMCTNLMDAKLYDKYYLQKPGRAFNLKLRLLL